MERSTPLDRMTPEQLAARSQHGSAEAFAVLVAMFEARLFNFILRKVGHRGDAEDLTQETFLRAWRRIGSYRARWRFSTWLYTIAQRLAISHARKGKGAARLGDGDSHVSPDGAVEASVGADTGEGISRIWRLVDRVLSEEQRTAVWLRYVEDLAIGEIGAVLGKSDVAVRVMLFRSRAILAEHLDGDVGERTSDKANAGSGLEVKSDGGRHRMAGGVR